MTDFYQYSQQEIQEIITEQHNNFKLINDMKAYIILLETVLLENDLIEPIKTVNVKGKK